MIVQSTGDAVVKNGKESGGRSSFKHILISRNIDVPNIFIVFLILR